MMTDNVDVKRMMFFVSTCKSKGDQKWEYFEMKLNKTIFIIGQSVYINKTIVFRYRI